jgi:hypothetical protein
VCLNATNCTQHDYLLFLLHCGSLQVHAKGRAPVFAYSNVFGEGGMNGTGVYYLASAADKASDGIDY